MHQQAATAVEAVVEAPGFRTVRSPSPVQGREGLPAHPLDPLCPLEYEQARGLIAGPAGWLARVASSPPPLPLLPPPLPSWLPANNECLVAGVAGMQGARGFFGAGPRHPALQWRECAGLSCRLEAACEGKRLAGAVLVVSTGCKQLRAAPCHTSWAASAVVTTALSSCFTSHVF